MIKLKEIRIRRGYTQKDIADILGVTVAAISRYEKEQRKLDQELIMKLCVALEVTPNELLGFDEAYENYTNYLMSLRKKDIEN